MTLRYSFSANERLKSRKKISGIFKNGKFTHSDSFALGYVLSSDKANKFAVSVPKKLFKSAVVRNKLKRRIKEAYRLNKIKLNDFSEKNDVFFDMLLIYKTKKVLPFFKIEEELTELLNYLQQKT